MPSCSVKWCSNHTSTCSLKSKNGVSFHRFPKDEAICQKWVEAVRFERRDPWWTSSNASRICSIHFKNSDISSTPCKVNILAKTAVPICTMIWYNDENNSTLETSNETINIKTILKTYERKKPATNVLKESKINMSNELNIEITKSKSNKDIISNITRSLSQVKVPEGLDTKLMKTLEVSKTQHLKECEISDSIENINLHGIANRYEIQKKLIELNRNKYVKSYKEKCQSIRHVILNENTRLIMEEDLNDLDSKFKLNKVSKEKITKTHVTANKITDKELNSNENKEHNQRVTNKTNTDIVIEIMKNVELKSNSYVGELLKTYMPKGKDNINNNNTRETCKDVKKNKNTWSLNKMNDRLNDKCHKNNLYKVLNTIRIKPNLKSNTISKDKTQITAFRNVKKYTFKRKIPFDRSRIREHNEQTVSIEPNMDTNKTSNIVDIDEFINQAKADNNKETDIAIDEIISELFEIPKNIGNESAISSTSMYENNCVESNSKLPTDQNLETNFDKEANNVQVILDLDTNIYTELNSIMDFEISEVDLRLNNETNTEINIEKEAINESFKQVNENTVTGSSQFPIINKNIPTEHSDLLISESHQYLNPIIKENVITQSEENAAFNENITNSAIILSNDGLQNSETSFVNNIVVEGNDKFTELKKHLSSKPKLHSLAELCINTLTDNNTNLFSKYENNILSTAVTTENVHVPGPNHTMEFEKHIDFSVNNMVSYQQNNINTDATKVIESNITDCKQLNSFLIEEFITNPKLNNRENIDLINNFNINANTTGKSEFITTNISDTNMDRTKYPDRDMPELNNVMNMELCNEVNIEFNDEMNMDKTGINESYTKFDKSTVIEKNQQLSIMDMALEHSDHLISESHLHLKSVNNENITQYNKKVADIENITYNTLMPYDNGLKSLETTVENNIVAETEKDKFVELKKHLSRKPNLDSVAELRTNTLADINKNIVSKCDNIKSIAINIKNLEFPDQNNTTEFDKDIEVNDMVTSLQNNIIIDDINTDSKQLVSILLKEFVTNISATGKNTENEELKKKIISDINLECKKNRGKDMPELDTIILTKFNEIQDLNSKNELNKKNNHLDTEMYSDRDLLFQKSNKEFESVLPSDEQRIVVNEHMDVVESILNRDTIEEFDVSLLLSDTPIPDDDIKDYRYSNVGNKTNNNSLDGIDGSPNWIQLPTDEMPKIIDDLLDQDSPFFENLDLVEKDCNFKLDKDTNNKGDAIKKPIKNSDSNMKHFEEQIINIFCGTGKNLIAELSEYDENNLVPSNIICDVNKDSKSKQVTIERKLYDEQTDKEIQEQYLQTNHEQCDICNNVEVVDDCYEQRNKKTQGSNKNISQKQNYNSNANQIKDVSIDQCFGPSLDQRRDTKGEYERGEPTKTKGEYKKGVQKSYIEQGDKLAIDNFNDETLSSEAILELSKKKYDKQSNNVTHQSCGEQFIRISQEESLPKPKIRNRDNHEPSLLKIDKLLSEDLNEKKIKEDNNLSNKTATTETKSGPELKFQQLKRVLFDECYDPECGSNCKNKKHKSDTELHKKDFQRYQKQNSHTFCQPDIRKRKKRYDLRHKRQCNQSSIDNFKKQLDEDSFDSRFRQNKKRLLEQNKLSHNNCKTKYKKIAIDLPSGQYIELRWQEVEEESNILSQEECKRQQLDFEQKSNKTASVHDCSITRSVFQSHNISENQHFSQQVMTECPECGYTNNDLINYKSDVDLRITKPLSLINKDMLLSLHDDGNKRISLESVYAMELAYVTAIQALERKLKHKIAISEYRLNRVNKLSKINSRLVKANIKLMDIVDENKM